MSDRRPKGHWKAKMFQWAWLYQRGTCADCGCGERFIYRKGGISGSYAKGDLHYIVHRSSNFELDHILPLHQGGGNEYDNIQLLCIGCHKRKTAEDRTRRAYA